MAVEQEVTGSGKGVASRLGSDPTGKGIKLTVVQIREWHPANAHQFRPSRRFSFKRVYNVIVAVQRGKIVVIRSATRLADSFQSQSTMVDSPSKRNTDGQLLVVKASLRDCSYMRSLINCVCIESCNRAPQELGLKFVRCCINLADTIACVAVVLKYVRQQPNIAYDRISIDLIDRPNPS